jgi:catechol 2,3-dioxygenase-like lactoylglutathione lyase family enzyme
VSNQRGSSGDERRVKAVWFWLGSDCRVRFAGIFKAIAATIVVVLTSLVAAQPASPARPAITGISHITLFADDIAKSQRFYTELLGWEQVPATAARSGVRFYANHSQYIELVSPPRPDLADRLDMVAFSTSDAEGLRKYLGANGIAVPNAVILEADGSRSFVVQDPEGNKVGFAQEGDTLRPEPASALRSVSSHIIHAGYVVRNRAALDHFYKDVLGFHLYWQGGNQDTRVDWVMMQVPDGTDWIEYMLYLPAEPSLAQLGSANHFAPGVVSVAELQEKLEAHGWKPAAGKDPKVLGVDGKMQLDLSDPDGTRVEFMEFAPVKTPCCSPYTGAQPKPSATW